VTAAIGLGGALLVNALSCSNDTKSCRGDVPAWERHAVNCPIGVSSIAVHLWGFRCLLLRLCEALDAL
jgi:hypothetical protein